MTKKFNVQIKKNNYVEAKSRICDVDQRVISSSMDEAASNPKRMKGLLGSITIRNVNGNDVSSTYVLNYVNILV
jgi:hypothetical protein